MSSSSDKGCPELSVDVTDGDAPRETSGSPEVTEALDASSKSGTTSCMTELRNSKVQAKTEFTNLRRGLLVSVTKGSLDESSILSGMDELQEAHSRLSEIITDMIALSVAEGVEKLSEKFVDELEKMERLHSEAADRLQQAYEAMNSRAQESSRLDEVETWTERARPGRSSSWFSGNDPDWSYNAYMQHSNQDQLDTVLEPDESRLSGSLLWRSLGAQPHRAMTSTSNSTSIGNQLTTAAVSAGGSLISGVQLPEETSPLTPGSSAASVTSQSMTSAALSNTVTTSIAGNGTTSTCSGTTSTSMGPKPSTNKSLHGVTFNTSPTILTSVSAASSTSSSTKPSIGSTNRVTIAANPVSGSASTSTLGMPTVQGWGSYSGGGGNGQHSGITGPWTQLRKIGIPVFKGEKKKYEAWKAAFTACIDRAPATPEYKLLQMKEYLSGEPLEAIDKFGYSAAAYRSAKELLDRKYGGTRRMIAIQLEELNQITSVTTRKSKEMERFTDLLSIAVVNLKDAGRTTELQGGTFYQQLLKKFDHTSLTQYHRWRHENREVECVEVLLKWAILETEFSVMSAETVHGFSGPSKPEQPRSLHKVERYHDSASSAARSRTRTFVTSGGKETPSGLSCPVCRGRHPVWSCSRFKAMKPSERWQKAKAAHLCYRCLASGHLGKDCITGRVCGINKCQHRHHRLLHDSRSETQQQATSASHHDVETVQDQSLVTQEVRSATKGEQAATDGQTFQTTTACSQRVALRTVPVKLSHRGRTVTVNALLDDASTRSYMSVAVAAELRLDGKAHSLTVSKLNGQEEVLETVAVECSLESYDGSFQTQLSACTVDRPAGHLPVVDWLANRSRYLHLADIPFPSLPARHSVDVLIGVDHPEMHTAIAECTGQPGMPVARRTSLGWTCVGPVKQPVDSGSDGCHLSYTLHTADRDLSSALKRLWEIEGLPTRGEPSLTLEEKKAQRQVADSISFSKGRYCVGIPWRDGRPTMPESYTKAYGRLRNLEKRLRRDPATAEAYGNVIAAYRSKGYIRQVPASEVHISPQWILPHFAVIRSDKATTKVRVVFDAAGVSNGVALNEVISAGPKLQQALPKVLLRFRHRPVAIICDIQEMYLQVELEPADRPYHRFLWRDCEVHRDPDVYEFSRVVFGVNASPFLAQFVSRHNAQIHAAEYPRAAETVLESTYMDDSMDSVRTDEAARDLIRELSGLWQEAGMRPRKWLSNSTAALQDVAKEDRAKEIDLVTSELPSVKALGVLWLAAEDKFAFRLSLPEADEKPTKRSFLRSTAKLFDPLGFLAPYLIRAKILLQDMWRCGADWDDELPSNIVLAVQAWFQEASTISNVRIDRCLQDATLDSPLVCELHVFTDASEAAYGAVAYLRSTYSTGETVSRFVASKAHVAPVTAVSIPRLELMAACVGAELAVTCAASLGMKAEEVTLWTDSSNVLHWVTSHSRTFKQFVASRVGEIQRQTNPDQWRYVPTSINPADMLSRGVPAHALATSKLWWHGPSFLLMNRQEWPTQPVLRAKSSALEQKADKQNQCHAWTGVTADDDGAEWRLRPDRWSDWDRLCRTTALVHRFVRNCAAPAEHRAHGELQPEEILEAEEFIIRRAQLEAQPEYGLIRKGRALPKNSRIVALQPFIDGSGLLRVGGRLQNASLLSYDQQHPILLPRGHHVTELIVKRCHEQGHHVYGVSHTLAELASRFWLVAGREEIKAWEAKCAVCHRRKARPATQVMAPLPKFRVSPPLRAFAKIAIDCAGPFTTRQGRGRTRQKRYLCLFTCLLTRAVHLELLFGLDTDSFLQGYLRFTNRRGAPIEVTSDNGTNFVGATNELADLAAHLDTTRIQRQTAAERTVWHFNPPAAPHFGGVHEALIKSAKRAIYAIIQGADVTDEELLSAVCGAEALLNSRPLSYQSADGRDLSPLTPNHFLFGRQGIPFVPAGTDDVPFNPRQRWRVIQEMLLQFWRRWMKEVVPELNRRLKWRSEQPELKVDDVVVVPSKDNPRGSWPLGRVVETYPGPDGHVRVVKVKVGGRELVRPIVRLCPLSVE